MDEILRKALDARWWYYGVELAPGVMARGMYPDDTPMIPRLLMRDIDVAGADCLDLGSMEGLIPALWKRRGAARVLATDALDHCTEKMAAVRHAYAAPFEFQRVGLMYDLSAKIAGGFDLINVSGLLYHVFSPWHVIAGVRPLLKRNGLMVVSTPVHERPDYTMEYNAKGRLQSEANTFWYPSAPLFEELLRSFGLAPIDALYLPFAGKGLVHDTPGVTAGYLSVVCRGTPFGQGADDWTQRMLAQSWEFNTLCDRRRAEAQPESRIPFAGSRAPLQNLHAALSEPGRRVERATDASEGHTLLLSHQH